MPERLLSLSEILLFGRVVEDLEIPKPRVAREATVATTDKLDEFKGTPEIDGVDVAGGNIVLVRKNSGNKNGIYLVEAAVETEWGRETLDKDLIVFVASGDDLGGTYWQQTKVPPKQKFKRVPRRSGRGLGGNKLLDAQLAGDAQFARIYGFSYEGTYYELPSPTLFLVDGKGDPATGAPDGPAQNAPGHLASRAPNEPSLSGVGAADYQIANDIRVWPYDKADYTIRMDVVTGMFEQVLLDLYFGFDSPAISGAKVSGAKVSGAKVSGAKVSGAKVSGAKVSGAKAYGGGD